MDLSMPAGTPAPLPATRGTFEDGDNVCPVCERWTCRCPSGRRLAAVGIIARRGARTTSILISPAGGRGSSRPAVAR